MGKRLLVVEDDALIAMAMADGLTDEGFDVVGPVHDLAAAMACAQTELLDAALLDLTLNGVPAYSVAEALRVRGVPTLLVTGRELGELPPSVHGAPAVCKPVSADVIAGHLRRMMPVG